jgi:hypothetical protein
VIWSSAVGAGRLIVSGALDAWRFRDPTVSGFDRFWRTLLAEAADAAPTPLVVEIATPVLAPGGQGSLTVTVRDAALADPLVGRSIRATVSASIVEISRDSASVAGADRAGRIQLWPEGAVGEFRGAFRAPEVSGIYRIAVAGGAARTDAPFVVLTAPSLVAPDATQLVAAFASSRAGMLIRSDELSSLVPAVERALQPITRRETWHPMRSGWWIIPFTLALGAEWAWRRRRGLA